jgi:hypothetical protein
MPNYTEPTDVSLSDVRNLILSTQAAADELRSLESMMLNNSIAMASVPGIDNVKKGIRAISNFKKRMQTAVFDAMANATQVSSKPMQKTVAQQTELHDLGAELPQTVGKRARKAPAPVQRSAKRKAN